jgi:hypothetical protein
MTVVDPFHVIQQFYEECKPAYVFSIAFLKKEVEKNAIDRHEACIGTL